MGSFDPTQATIFVTLSGSHAYGTARDGSDVDVRGVCVAPLAVRLSYREAFEQHEGPLGGAVREMVRAGLERHPTAGTGGPAKFESVLFDLVKLVRLAALSNPNALEILFADEPDWLYATPLWRSLHAERHRFLSARVEQTYLGYALAQLRRIRTHRSWLLAPPTREPTRAEYGLPERSTLPADDRDRIERGIAERIRGWGIDALELPKADRIALETRLREFWSDVLACREDRIEEMQREVATQTLGIPQSLLRTLDAERSYRAARKHWESYLRWRGERNPERALLESSFGYDTKHAAHLIRLMRTGIEVLETGELEVRRKDAEELVRIRQGKYSYDQLVEEAARLENAIQTAARRSVLPAEVDRDSIDTLLVGLLVEYYGL